MLSFFIKSLSFVSHSCSFQWFRIDRCRPLFVAMSDSSSSSSSNKNESLPSNSPQPGQLCHSYIEDLRNLGYAVIDACPVCTTLVGRHLRAPLPNSTNSTSSNNTSLASHIQKSLPIWAPGKQSCHAFLQSFENIMIASDAPKSIWPRSLLFSFPKVIEQNWIKQNILDKNLDWDQAKEKLKSHFESYNYNHKLQLLYDECKQVTRPMERVQKYADRYLDICSQLLIEDDNKLAINHFINGLSLPIRKELQRRIDIARSLQPDQEIETGSLLRVADLAIKIDTAENGLTSLVTHHETTTQATASKCTYHPHSSTHTTDECSKNPSNMSASPSRVPSPPPNPLTSRSPQSTSTPAQRTLRCYQCGKEGHTASRCRQPVPSSMSTRSGPIARSQINNIDDNDNPIDNQAERGDTEETAEYENVINNMNRVPNLSKQEYDRCLKEGVCFRCKQPNHLARNCTKRENNNRKNIRSELSKNSEDQHSH